MKTIYISLLLLVQFVYIGTSVPVDNGANTTNPKVVGGMDNLARKPEERYTLSTRQVEWSTAIMECKNTNPKAELATIQNEKDYQELKKFIYGEPSDLSQEYWVGAKFIENNNCFVRPLRNKCWRWWNRDPPVYIDAGNYIRFWNYGSATGALTHRLTVVKHAPDSIQYAFASYTDTLKYICDSTPS